MAEVSASVIVVGGGIAGIIFWMASF